ncbi:hypothetical protein [Siccibacter turicensis]|uniref:hypothetical protein n=1 Tax=Siccibacter turicensis TaxID=357233 RepID=UPI0023F2AAA1|nr:hypothetical protein [Siccibacter turicensis]
MSEDKAGLVLNAIGMAVMDLMAANEVITKESLIQQLEGNLRESVSFTGKMANRDAIEVVRNWGRNPLH